jgi:hypothetical protein
MNEIGSNKTDKLQPNCTLTDASGKQRAFVAREMRWGCRSLIYMIM